MGKTKSFFQGFLAGLEEFGKYLTNAVNTLLLLVAYLVGIGITSLVAKLTGKHFLSTQKGKSYWLQTKPAKGNLEDYYRQF